MTLRLPKLEHRRTLDDSEDDDLPSLDVASLLADDDVTLPGSVCFVCISFVTVFLLELELPKLRHLNKERPKMSEKRKPSRPKRDQFNFE